MLVTHVITRLIVGGAQENTVATVLGLLNYPNYDVELISGPTPPDQPEGSIQGTVDSVPGLVHIIPELVRPVSPINDFRALLSLRDRFIKTRPHIVHTHSGKAGVLGRLAARLAGVPHIVHTIHGPSFGSFQGPLANGIFKWAERLVGRSTDCFIGVADAMCEQYLEAGIGRPDEYKKVLSGFDLSPLLNAENDPAIRARWGIGPDDFVIGKVGRLFRLKGHDDLLSIAPKIMEENPNAKLLLVGGGEWRERFERIVEERGLVGRVIFTGLVRPEEVPGLIGIMDLVVHLSRREGLPRVIPQALAAGKPVVAMDSDGAREVCLDGVNGYLVPVGSTSKLADRVAELGRDPRLRETFGQRGRQFVEQEFSTGTMVSRIARIYDELVQDGNKSKRSSIDH